MTLTNQQNVGTVKFSELRYADAKAMAVYAAYLFEKLVYGNNFPKAEYNRKLEVIKTLSAKDIEFVNSKVAGKLEKVYTVLKEMASEKSNACEPPRTERFKRIEIPERNKLAIQQAIAEMKQKPSLFQRIKNWFAN